MGNNWWKIILAASLALNLAFISVLVLKKAPQAPAPASQSLSLKPELNLEPEQKQALMSIIDQFRLDMLGHKQDILEKRIEIIEELSDPECDFQSLSRKSQELNQYEGLMNSAFIETLIEINNMLDPCQRLSFLLGLSKNWFFIHPSSAENQPGILQEEK